MIENGLEQCKLSISLVLVLDGIAFVLGDFVRYYLCGIITEADDNREEKEEEQHLEGMVKQCNDGLIFRH